MPLNASIGLITLFYSFLAARFGAAENPLRIPKVTRQSCTEPYGACSELHSFYALLRRPGSNPCQGARFRTVPLFTGNPGNTLETVVSAAVCTPDGIEAARADGAKPQE